VAAFGRAFAALADEPGFSSALGPEPTGA
jgi:hypothetical protein